MEADYISRKAAIRAVRDQTCWRYNNSAIDEIGAISNIEKITAADVRPVVRGKWTEIDASYWRWKHDGAHMVFRKKYKHIDCGEVCASKKPYCPNCGADMRGGGRNE